jgi:hypothetical protein
VLKWEIVEIYPAIFIRSVVSVFGNKRTQIDDNVVKHAAMATHGQNPQKCIASLYVFAKQQQR